MAWKKPLGIGIALLIVAVVAAAAWWLGFLTPEPDEVSLAETVAAVAASDTGTDEGPAQAPAADETIEVPTGSTPLAGAWQIVIGDATFVGYRADSPTGEAVGRTRGVQGLLIASDTEILDVDVTADMTTLASDSRFRDEHLGTEGLETRTYTASRFVLTDPIAVDLQAVDGASGSFDAIGELTVKDTTEAVTVRLEGTLVGEQLVVVGSTELDLRVFSATISGIETATMEFSLVFAPKR